MQKHLCILSSCGKVLASSQHKLALMKMDWASFPLSARLDSVSSSLWSLGRCCNYVGLGWILVISVSSPSSEYSNSWCSDHYEGSGTTTVKKHRLCDHLPAKSSGIASPHSEVSSSHNLSVTWKVEEDSGCSGKFVRLGLLLFEVLPCW